MSKISDAKLALDWLYSNESSNTEVLKDYSKYYDGVVRDYIRAVAFEAHYEKIGELRQRLVMNIVNSNRPNMRNDYRTMSTDELEAQYDEIIAEYDELEKDDLDERLESITRDLSRRGHTIEQSKDALAMTIVQMQRKYTF